MTAEVYRCPKCGKMDISYDYGHRLLVCTKCKTPLKEFSRKKR